MTRSAGGVGLCLWLDGMEFGVDPEFEFEVELKVLPTGGRSG